MRKLIVCSSVVLMALGAGTVLAQESNRFGVEWDADAVAQMSREERLAYQREYKAALEDAAREAGFVAGESKTHTPRTAVVTPRVPGTAISYHSGSLSAATLSSFTIGNRFDTALTGMGGLGPVEMSGSITMITVDMAAVGGGAAFLSVYDQLAGTTVNQITSVSFPMATGVNTITLATPLTYVGSSFLAGAWNFTGGPDTVNVATGTVGGQGFHGMEINDGAVGMSFVAYTMTNGTAAVQGNVATPVELMHFEIAE
jgi:hypothetical protein